jgi:hypothetical protein
MGNSLPGCVWNMFDVVVIVRGPRFVSSTLRKVRCGKDKLRSGRQEAGRGTNPQRGIDARGDVRARSGRFAWTARSPSRADDGGTFKTRSRTISELILAGSVASWFKNSSL